MDEHKRNAGGLIVAAVLLWVLWPRKAAAAVLPEQQFAVFVNPSDGNLSIVAYPSDSYDQYVAAGRQQYTPLLVGATSVAEAIRQIQAVVPGATVTQRQLAARPSAY